MFRKIILLKALKLLDYPIELVEEVLANTLS